MHGWRQVGCADFHAQSESSAGTGQGLQIQGAQPKASAAQRMKQAARPEPSGAQGSTVSPYGPYVPLARGACRTAAALSTLKGDAPAGSAGARHFHSVEDFKDDPKAQRGGGS